MAAAFYKGNMKQTKAKARDKGASIPKAKTGIRKKAIEKVVDNRCFILININTRTPPGKQP